MGRIAKTGLVSGGYLAAILAGIAAARLYDVRMAAQPYDTSGGMHAAGQSITALAAFLLFAIIPTLLMLWFLRSNTRFWNVVATASLAFASVGLIAVLATLRMPGAGRTVPTMLLDVFGLAQLLGVPLWCAAFVLFALIAPTRGTRRALVAAIAIEMVIGVCAFVHWFVPGARL